MNPSLFRVLRRQSRPIFLLGAALFYALGAGVAHYLGISIDWGLYVLGQAWVTALQLSAHFLYEYFEYSSPHPVPPDANLFSRTSRGTNAEGNNSSHPELEKLPRPTYLIAATIALTITAFFTVLLLQVAPLSPLLGFILIVGFLGAFFYSVPPVHLATSGYGELMISILVANLIPAFAFLLQFSDLHRLIMMVTLPLTSLHLAMMLALEFPTYAANLKRRERNLLVRLGWKTAMKFHNILILSTFLLLGLAMVYGLSFTIAIPSFLVLPLGLLQIWQMHLIDGGAKPNWKILSLTAVASLGSMVYLLAFAFWIR